MYLLFASAKLAVEPAGAAATAALCGPLLERLRGKRVGLIVCGANIDHTTFAAQMPRALRREVRWAVTFCYSVWNEYEKATRVRESEEA